MGTFNLVKFILIWQKCWIIVFLVWCFFPNLIEIEFIKTVMFQYINLIKFSLIKLCVRFVFFVPDSYLFFVNFIPIFYMIWG